MRKVFFGLIAVLALGGASAEAAPAWRSYVDQTLGFRIDLPVGSFNPTADSAERHIQLTETDGDAQIDVYGGEDPERLTPEAFADQLANADRIADVTYRRVSRTWFVLSGHYRRADDETGTLIFYAKFMFTPDLSRFSAFEISYSVDEKRRMDPIVTRLERTLRRPAKQ